MLFGNTALIQGDNTGLTFASDVHQAWVPATLITFVCAKYDLKLIGDEQ